MAEIMAPFEVNGNYPLDKRQVFNTVEEMNNFDTLHLPDAYFATCIETGLFYVYNKGIGWSPVSNQLPGSGVAIIDDKISVNTDNIWITVDNNNKVTFTSSAKSAWNDITEQSKIWKNVTPPPTAIDNKYYGIINNTWQELKFESYNLSDTVITAVNGEGKTEIQSRINISLNDDGLIQFNNSKFIE